MFNCGQEVQLREARTEVRPGEHGRVVGRYTHDSTLVVAFSRATIRVKPELVAVAARRSAVAA
jgi:hypothetical protein